MGKNHTPPVSLSEQQRSRHLKQETKPMKKILLAASIALIAATSVANADPFMPIENDPNVFVNNPVIQELEEIAC